ncbi:uncharacterized protein LOC130655793 isoform X1 [Hydractinia symbiolongicarpus]|uniref:uncharacterized protein LOC130655793 isoform X1 n=1 Tax=Hydractinia symbiolongicarpus TaxID=13093 RepID=UPI00254F7AE9|nr:uncharacterized protein LOC130655793 isoform X1 [Hydractinia symbiolongicarpus]
MVLIKGCPTPWILRKIKSEEAIRIFPSCLSIRKGPGTNQIVVINSIIFFPIITGGLVKDVCNCCYVCAKVKGETCGGPFQIAGKCAKGLTCRKTPKPGQILFNLRGICSCGPVCRIYCRYGNVHNRFGCPTCRCHKYPRCRRYPYSPYHHGGRRSYPFWHCRRHETVFCKRDCKTCCRHSTTCAPNHWYTRKQRYCHIYRH